MFAALILAAWHSLYALLLCNLQQWFSDKGVGKTWWKKCDGLCSNASFKTRRERCFREQTCKPLQPCACVWVHLYYCGEVMFVLWAVFLHKQCRAAAALLFTHQTFWEEHETSSSGAALLWLRLTNTHTLDLLSSPIFTFPQPNTLHLCNTHFLFAATLSAPHTHMHTHLLGVIKQQIRVIGCWQGLTLKSAVVGRLPGRCSLLTKLVGLDRRGTTVLLSGDLEQP